MRRQQLQPRGPSNRRPGAFAGRDSPAAGRARNAKVRRLPCPSRAVCRAPTSQAVLRFKDLVRISAAEDGPREPHRSTEIDRDVTNARQPRTTCSACCSARMLGSEPPHRWRRRWPSSLWGEGQAQGDATVPRVRMPNGHPRRRVAVRRFIIEHRDCRSLRTIDTDPSGGPRTGLLRAPPRPGEDPRCRLPWRTRCRSPLPWAPRTGSSGDPCSPERRTNR